RWQQALADDASVGLNLSGRPQPPEVTPFRTTIDSTTPRRGKRPGRRRGASAYEDDRQRNTAPRGEYGSSLTCSVRWTARSLDQVLRGDVGADARSWPATPSSTTRATEARRDGALVSRSSRTPRTVGYLVR